MKISAEKLREWRLWIKEIGIPAVIIGVCVWDAARHKDTPKVVYNETVYNTRPGFKNTFQSSINKVNDLKYSLIKDVKEKERRIAKDNGYTIREFERYEWNERYTRYSLMKQTNGLDGYYFEKFSEKAVYVYIKES